MENTQIIHDMVESHDKSPPARLRWHEQFWVLWAVVLAWIALIHIATRIYWLTHPNGPQ